MRKKTKNEEEENYYEEEEDKYEEEEGIVFFLSHRWLQGFSHCGQNSDYILRLGNPMEYFRLGF